MDIRIEVDTASLTETKRELRDNIDKLRKAISGAVNDTAKHEKSFISTQIRDRVNIKKKDLDPHLTVSRSTPDKLTATVTLDKTDRLGLKYFGARQTAKGVTYKIAKGGKIQKIADAFGPKIPRLGGQVFRRVGKSRKPIMKLFGPSAWGVFVVNKMRQPTEQDAQAYLANRLRHRLEYQT